MVDVNELLERTEAIAETKNNCANGVHSFTSYEEAVYDNGCGATDEKEIPALEHKNTDGDYLCDNDCGYELEKEDEEDNVEDDAVCEYCEEVHKNLLQEIICLFTEFFHLVAKALRTTTAA